MAEWFQGHVLVVLLTIGTVFSFFWLLYHRESLNMNRYAALPASVAHTIWGVFAVTVFAFAEAGFDPKSLGNMSLFGGVFLMPVFYLILSKIFKVKPGKVFDICTICMLFTLMCARINCIFSGCCRGLQIPGSMLRWPTREAEIVFYIILITVIWRKLKRGNTKGLIYPEYMMTYGVFRFVIEFFRTYDGTSLIHPAHIWSVISFCIGLSIYGQIRSLDTAPGSEKKNRRYKKVSD